MNTDPSLNDVLASLGLSTQPAPGQYAKHILDREGRVVFTGRAGEVWAWLRTEGLL